MAKVTAKGDEVRAAKAAKADVNPLLGDYHIPPHHTEFEQIQIHRSCSLHRSTV